jgi:ketosteroid isomerase-like protein
MSAHQARLRALYDAICTGAAGAEIAAHFHPDAVQVEYPSLLRPHGHRRPLAEIAAAAEQGRQVVREQRIEVHQVIEAADRAAVQLTWTATLARDLGKLAAGTRLVAHVAAFYEFRDGLVLRQSSYDCYEPLVAAD